MAARAELKARLSLNKSLFDRGIAGAQAGASRLAAGLHSASRIGARGFTLGATAAAGLSAAVAIGTKRAFDLGGRMVDIRNLTGRSAKQIMVMRRALEDAGVSMEKIDTYMVTGRDRGNVIARTLANLTQEDWASAARSVGTQADILNRSADKFDKISDLLGHSGQKFQGFFVGVADRVADSLLPILEKLDKTDLAGIGQKFGEGLVQGAQIIVGLFNDPKLLFSTMEGYFRAAALGMGNVLIAAFQASLEFLKSGMMSLLTGIGSTIIATLTEAFATPIALFQAGIEHALNTIRNELGAGSSTTAIDFQIKAKEKLQSALGTNMSGKLNSYGKALQGDIDKLKARREEIKKTVPVAESFEDIFKRKLSEGVRVGFDKGGMGMTAEEWRRRGGRQVNAGMAGAASAAAGLNVVDVLGAGSALSGANKLAGAAATAGKKAMQVGTVAGQGRDTFYRPLVGSSSMDRAYKTHPDAYGRAHQNTQTDEKKTKPIDKEEMDQVLAKYF